MLITASIVLAPVTLRAQDAARPTTEQGPERTFHRRAVEAVIRGMPTTRRESYRISSK